MVEKALGRLNKNGELRRWLRGQSLVEYTLALPLLLAMLAGIAEVGNLFVQRNRATLVARETARFVATGGADTDALVVSQQAVQISFGGEVLAFDEEHMNIYIIHATVNSAGSAILDDGDIDNCSSDTDFCETHIYPTQQYYDDNFGGVDQDPHSAWTSAQIYDRLSQSDAIPNADMQNLQVVAAVVQYTTTTLLDLPIFPQTNGGVPLNEITIMRQEATIAEAAGAPSQGCSAYPILVGQDALVGAGTGDTITVSYGTDLDDFNYALWNDDNLTGGTGVRLKASLGGDQIAAGDPPVGNAKDGTYGYIDPDDSNDTTLHKLDFVLRNTGPSSGVDPYSMLQDHITDERAMRILEFSSHRTSPDDAFEISGILIVRLTSLDSLTGTLEFEFIRRDNSCGN